MWIYAVLLIVLFNMATFRASKVLISLFAKGEPATGSAR